MKTEELKDKNEKHLASGKEKKQKYSMFFFVALAETVKLKEKKKYI